MSKHTTMKVKTLGIAVSIAEQVEFRLVSTKNPDAVFKDIVGPIRKQIRETILDAVLDELESYEGVTL